MTEIPISSAVDEAGFASLIEWTRQRGLTNAEIARVATHLAESGEKLTWPAGLATADLASTGGPGSLSTLLTPFILNARGFKVVKLAVPGRPAGAIDALATIPGYRVDLTAREVRSIVGRCGFAHFLAGQTFTPLDGALYSFRRRIGAIAIPELATASILSKKVASGVRFVGLDVRVGPHGNFGVTAEDARINASRLCCAAKLLDMKAMAFLCGGQGPMQPWIGRGESLLAMAHCVGCYELEDPTMWLRYHVSQCLEMAATMADSWFHRANVRSSESASRTETNSLRSSFENHLQAQGVSMDNFESRIEVIATASREIIGAGLEGELSIDLAAIRAALIALQSDETPNAFSDPAGLQLLVRPGSPVVAGQPLARVRCERDETVTTALLKRLSDAFHVTVNKKQRRDRDDRETAPSENTEIEVICG